MEPCPALRRKQAVWTLAVPRLGDPGEVEMPAGRLFRPADELEADVADRVELSTASSLTSSATTAQRRSAHQEIWADCLTTTFAPIWTRS